MSPEVTIAPFLHEVGGGEGLHPQCKYVIMHLGVILGQRSNTRPLGSIFQPKVLETTRSGCCALRLPKCIAHLSLSFPLDPASIIPLQDSGLCLWVFLPLFLPSSSLTALYFTSSSFRFLLISSISGFLHLEPHHSNL